MFGTIVVAVDGSEHAENALRIACDIAKKYKSKLHLVHSPELETVTRAVGASAYAIEPSAEKIAEAGKGVMDRASEQARQYGCAPAKCIIGNRKPAQEVLQQARESNADLIVMGRRGLGGLSSLILGSVSLKVSNATPCACMTVK